MLALWQWLLAANQPAEKLLSRILFHLALGNLCMAFVAGCRPQMVLFAALCLPIFWQRYLREKRLFAAKLGITEAVAFVLPVVLVAIGLMWYNAARFGSPFDFGANYNLTSNDMTRRGFSVGRTAPAVLTFLFGIPGVQAVFPYLTATKMQTNYMGLTITELFYGGAFACLPLLWGLASLPLARRRLAAKRDLRTFVVVVLAAMLVLAVLDCQMAGMLYRYQSDWLGPLLLAAAMAWALAEQVLQAHAAQSGIDVLQRAFCTILPLAVLAGACYISASTSTAEPGLIGRTLPLTRKASAAWSSSGCNPEIKKRRSHSMAEKNLYTVIVARDEDELREAVCTMIPWEASGFRLVKRLPAAAWAFPRTVRAAGADLLLTDIRMPFITGIDWPPGQNPPAICIAF